jgi:predicted dehydrogenase
MTRPSRRDFVRSAAVAAAGGAALSACATSPAAAAAAPAALPRDLPPRAPGDGSIRVGIVGFGVRSRQLLGEFLADPKCTIVAVADVVAARAQEGARIADEGRKRHVCRIAADWRDVIADREVDAVLVGTPDHWHAEPAIAAALAGKHVFCEKPLTLTIAEGRAIAAAVAATDVCFQTGSQQRSEFGHHFVRAAEAVRNGRIGKVRRITIHTGDPAIACDLPAQPLPEGIDWDGWVGQAPMRPFHADLCPIGMHGHFPAWRKYREYANGGLADMGAHHFDIAQWALGMDHSGPVRVLPPADREAKRGLVLVYADGCEMVHGGPTDCTFEGELGTIECSRGHSRAFRGTDRSAPDAPELLAEPKDGELRFPRNKGHVADFLAAIREGRDPICTAEIGHRTATVCHLASIGYRLGLPLQWDPVAERFVGDNAAAGNALLGAPVRPHA